MATTKKTTTKEAVKSTSVIQYQGLEFSEADCVKKATAQFKKDYKGVELGKRSYIQRGQSTKKLLQTA